MSNATTRSNATGITLTVLGGALALWVVARFASFSGLQQTWAPPFARYEWAASAGRFTALTDFFQPVLSSNTAGPPHHLALSLTFLHAPFR